MRDQTASSDRDAAVSAEPAGQSERDEEDELGTLRRLNRERLVAEMRAGAETLVGRPAHYKIELTNYCNLACVMCPHPSMEREVGYMRPEVFRKIIDEISPEAEFVYLHHLGESLFHPRIGELIRYARDHRVPCGLSTNATYLDERKGRALLDAGIDLLIVSLDGASPESYERVRVGGDFARTVRNVERFFELVERTPGSRTRVAVQMIVLPETQPEIDAFAAKWGDRVTIKIARDWAGQVVLPRGFGGGGFHKTLDACRLLWTELTVLWDGDVVTCANVYEKINVLGNLATQPLEDVWNGPLMRELRRRHLADQVRGIRVCETCPRHKLDADDFVRVDQLQQRVRAYGQGGRAAQPGLS
jgi:radical SAM protein with 4Fe4S-binding SPASM domain